MPQPLAQKLQLLEVDAMLLINKPEKLNKKIFSPVQVVTNPNLQSKFQAVFLFSTNQSELGQHLDHCLEKADKQSLFWIAYPKKSGSIETDITRDNGWDKITQLGFVPVRQVAVDDDWSALRFRKTTDIPKMVRGKEWDGVDPETNTVVPPDDFKEALEKKNLLEVFDQLNYGEKREHVISILEAKKPDTRASRIKKAVNLVRKKAPK